MDITTFLAQIWGPALLAVGIGVFTSRNYYVKIYRDLEKETLGLLLFALVAIGAGIVQIKYHSLWESFPQVVVSILGWGLFLKGVIFAVAPHAIDKVGNWEADSKMVPVAGTLMVVLGIYLSWYGFFM